MDSGRGPYASRSCLPAISALVKADAHVHLVVAPLRRAPKRRILGFRTVANNNKKTPLEGRGLGHNPRR
jgi:hypothetical protein